ncbi:MAG: hypothetical protein A2029_12300 [Chloroflexi bacterium RBG_19FT_COMBO_47_9]|jgi:hypothetical protein|nr:MAG: hypothetical protein A2029_12300 [Chloroflexi bacterium RBG_19FT_COMBO_47_9]
MVEVLAGATAVLSGILVASAVLVDVAIILVGVQEGTRVKRGVTVMVGGTMEGYKVGGGKGLIPLYGLAKINRKTDTTQRIVTSTTIVRTFHTNADGVFLWGGSFVSDIS